MELQLYEVRHPNKLAEHQYEQLIAIDQQKSALLSALQLFFHKERVEKWHRKHHQEALAFFDKIVSGTPLFILAGDSGCGKTALAHSIATPLGKILDKRIVCFETPSNIRGAGRVGEISSRITEAFSQAKAKIKQNESGILIIDEADDLATDREQNQAHHEDRAGLNVLIKQMDAIAREEIRLAIILITNRLKVLDPAVVRRAAQTITFSRPDHEGRKLVFLYLFEGVQLSEKDLEELVQATEGRGRLYSFSDLIQKVGKQALFKAIEKDQPFNKAIYLETLQTVEPSPLIQ